MVLKSEDNGTLTNEEAHPVYVQGCVYRTIVTHRLTVALDLISSFTWERSRPHLVGDPSSTNTLLEELFASLRMPDRIAPVERVPSSYTKCFS
jgi:hypothetical protein